MNLTPMTEITEDDVLAYERDGVVCIRGVFGREWVARLVRAVDRTMQAPGERARESTKPGRPGRHHSNTFMWRWDADMRALALDSPMIGVAAKLLRADRLAFFYDQLFVKEPGTQEVTPWHQDLPYFPMQGHDIISIWLALTPVTLKSSAVQYIAGSHKWNRLFSAESSDGSRRYVDPEHEPCPDFFDEKMRRGHKFLYWDLKEGDVVCHHPLTVHGSAGNETQSQRRIGISLRYTGNDARWDHRARTMPIPGEPEKVLKRGDPPILKDVLPLVWQRSSATS